MGLYVVNHVPIICLNNAKIIIISLLYIIIVCYTVSVNIYPEKNYIYFCKEYKILLSVCNNRLYYKI